MKFRWQNLVIVPMIVIQLFCLVSFSEWFPFSPFPMYKGKEDGRQLELFFSFYLDDQGNRHRFQWHTLVAPLDFLLRVKMRKVPIEGPMTLEQIEYLESVMSDYDRAHQRDKKKHKIKFVKYIFVRQYWNQFTEATWRKPDVEYVYYERDL